LLAIEFVNSGCAPVGRNDYSIEQNAYHRRASSHDSRIEQLGGGCLPLLGDQQHFIFQLIWVAV
jgi:hypothetical protein